MRKRRRKLLIVVGFLVEPIALKLRGYPLGGNVVVRCRAGHLYTTLWVPSVSIKAVRLLWKRFQYCPVGKHWTLVEPVREGELSDDERHAAAAVHDVRVP